MNEPTAYEIQSLHGSTWSIQDVKYDRWGATRALEQLRAEEPHRKHRIVVRYPLPDGLYM